MLEICAASSMTVSSWRTFSKTKQFWQFRRNESFLRILKDISWPKFPFCSESQLLTWLFNPWKNFSILLLLVTLVTLLKAVMLSLMFQISSRFFTCVWSRDLTSFYWNINHQTLAEKPVLVGSPHDDQKKIILIPTVLQLRNKQTFDSFAFCAWMCFMRETIIIITKSLVNFKIFFRSCKSPSKWLISAKLSKLFCFQKKFVKWKRLR